MEDIKTFVIDALTPDTLRAAHHELPEHRFMCVAGFLFVCHSFCNTGGL